MSKKPTTTKTTKTLDPEEVWDTADSYYWVGRAVVEVTTELEEDGFLPKGSAKEIEEWFNSGQGQFVYEDDLLIIARDYISEWIYRQFPDLPKLYVDEDESATDYIDSETFHTLTAIGRLIAREYEGKYCGVEIDTKYKSLVIHCTDRGEQFNVRKSFKELKEEYDLDIKVVCQTAA